MEATGTAKGRPAARPGGLLHVQGEALPSAQQLNRAKDRSGGSQGLGQAPPPDLDDGTGAQRSSRASRREGGRLLSRGLPPDNCRPPPLQDPTASRPRPRLASGTATTSPTPWWSLASPRHRTCRPAPRSTPRPRRSAAATTGQEATAPRRRRLVWTTAARRTRRPEGAGQRVCVQNFLGCLSMIH